MIDEKKIEEAANEAADLYEQDLDVETYYGDTENDGKIHFCREHGADLFKDGINWFLDNLWHDGEEIPKEKNKHILMYYESYSVGERELDYDEYYDLCHTGKDGFDENTWKIFCDVAGWCSKWLYIDDLLKGGK